MPARTKNSKTIRCAIVGASGYAGLETLRLLSGHPSAKIVFATSNTYKGRAVKDVFPGSGAPAGLKYAPHLEAADFKGADVFFLALPHGESFGIIESLLVSGKVVDISADFRLRDAAAYPAWYGFDHPMPKLLRKAVYGLTELYGDKVSGADFVANPGCYPTSVALALAPLRRMRASCGAPVICDSKSGYSGAGRSLKPHLLFCEATDEFTAYNVVGHRHTSEMIQETAATFGKAVPVLFTPHLIPVSRGILSTIYVPLVKNASVDAVRKIYADFYREKPFVAVGPGDLIPSVKRVLGTNMCHINVFVDAPNRTLKIFSAIDNLVKGAAGQAIQNMNLMFGLPETTGLPTVPLMP